MMGKLLEHLSKSAFPVSFVDANYNGEEQFTDTACTACPAGQYHPSLAHYDDTCIGNYVIFIISPYFARIRCQVA
jgi:hypothetical protein